MDPVTLTVTASEQAAILRAAADRVHASMGPVLKHEATPEQWAAYVVARRRAALDLVAERAVCAALGVEAVPPWLMVKGAAGHAKPLRLDFEDLGLAPYVAHVTIEGQAVQFRGALPLEWVSTAETDPGHPLRALSREGDLCVQIPSALLVAPEEVRDNAEAMAEGLAEYPAPPPPGDALAPTAAPEPVEAMPEPVPAPEGHLTPEQRAALPAAFAQFPGVPVTWRDGAWVPMDPETAPQELQEAPSDHVEATAGEMAAGLLRSAGRLVRHGIASPEVKAMRLSTCDACPHRLKSGRCAKCGCVLAAKTGIAAEACPIGKW